MLQNLLQFNFESIAPSFFLHSIVCSIPYTGDVVSSAGPIMSPDTGKSSETQFNIFRARAPNSLDNIFQPSIYCAVGFSA